MGPAHRHTLHHKPQSRRSIAENVQLINDTWAHKMILSTSQLHQILVKDNLKVLGIIFWIDKASKR